MTALDVNQSCQQKLDDFKVSVSSLLSSLLSEHADTIHKQIMDQHFEYKSLYDYSNLGLSELTNIYNSDRAFITNFLISSVKSNMMLDEKWFIIGNGTNQYCCISTYSKVISFNISSRNEIHGSLFDHKFKLPRMFIQTLRLFPSGSHMHQSSIDINSFLSNIKQELAQNVYLSPYGETIMEKYQSLQSESEKDKETILSLKNQILNMNRIKKLNQSLKMQNFELMEKQNEDEKLIERLTQKIEQLEQTLPHPPKIPMIMEDKT